VDPLATFGANIQRTMTLLGTSGPDRRNKVKILFYGQSITEQDWSRKVAEDLKQRFPHADLEIKNLALGGFASQILVRVAEHDVYPWYPDLVIFHVYGANGEYEEIIRNIRRRTTAEVLMQTDHVAKWPAEVPDEKKDKGLWWDHMMNRKFLPEIAKKYGCELADIRGPWLDYLRSNKLEPKALLRDDVHLNAHGDFLMAGLVKRYLVHHPKLPTASWQDLVREIAVGTPEARWKEGRLVVEFEGNRVDAVASLAAAKAGALEVRIDGKKPSEFPDGAYFTRTGPTQTGYWPAILRVQRQALLVPEEWTLKITEVDDAANTFKFEVKGYKTGPDGAGSSEQKFVSNSGRVVIEPRDWWMRTAREWTGRKVPVGHTVRWEARELGVDRYDPPPMPEPGREYVTTLAQGLPNGRHKLELTGPGGVHGPIRLLRIYRPPVK
jgi:hypothetical protein